MSDLNDYFILLPPALLLARGDSFIKKSLISIFVGIALVGSIFFMGKAPSTSDGMEMIVPLIYVPGYFSVLAAACLIFGIFSIIIPKFEAREKNKRRIQEFKGEWIVVILIIILSGILMRNEYMKILLPLKEPLNVPEYKIREAGGTKKYYTVLYANGFGYHFDQKPTNEQIENLYRERTKLLPKTPALEKQYERHMFYGIDKDIKQLVIYRKKIGQKVLLLGYPVYILIMLLVYEIGILKRKIYLHHYKQP